MTTRLTLLLALFLILFCANLMAGQLSPSLAQKMTALDTDQTFRVWIRLPDSPTARALKTMPPAASAAEQHRDAITNLKLAHQGAQRELIGYLETLERRNQVARIKPHWLVNMVEVDIAASELNALAARSDIDVIYPEPEVQGIRPVYEAALSEADIAADSVMDNLKHIKAPQAWNAGWTGSGRVICSFDTGVQGDHPALQRSWRGRGGSRQDSLASWFDPTAKQLAPHTFNNSYAPMHGTHTMGIMVGLDSVNDRAYGVAPDAKWISAAVIDIPGASVADAFEWAADPDGDPNTVSDRPDVINHSWGYENRYVGCENMFYDFIEATEALGIVNIFAAGNTGSTASTIYNPANRANDSLDCFAVGMLRFTTATPTVDPQSSRGPSTCNGAIKPNVMAPGYQVRSTLPGSNYGVMTGSSMAAPHVSGLVALLRQKNPAATVTQIKQAILNTTQTFSWSTPNNDVGWGEIDCLAALNALPAAPGTPQVRLYDFIHASIEPGDIVTGPVVVQNLGTNVNGLTGTITGTHPLLTITDGTVGFGAVGPNAVDTSSDNLSVTVSNSVAQGQVITVPFQITNGPYTVNTSLAFVVQPRNSKSLATHQTSRLTYSVSNFGAIGLGAASIFPAGGAGFNLDNLGSDLYEGGVMASTGPTKISAALRFQLNEPELDFRVAPNGDMTFQVVGTGIDEVSRCKFDDSGASFPIGLEVTQNAYSFAPPYGDIAVLQFILKNNSGGTLSNLKFGLSLDWDISPSYSRNAGGWESTEQFLWSAYNSGSYLSPNLTRFRGAKLLEGPLATAVTSKAFTVWLAWWGAGANGYTDVEKYQLLNAGLSNPIVLRDSINDLVQTIAAGPLTLAAGQLDTVVIALIGGADLTTIRDAATRAPFAYALVAGQAPSVATQISPTANGVVPSLLPTFVWHKSTDPNPNDVVHYTLRYGSDPGLSPAAEIADITDTTVTLTDSLVDLSEYYWQVVSEDNVGLSSSSPIQMFSTDISTDVPGDDPTLPRNFALMQNYPNPFNPNTTIAFELPRASEYQLTVYDVTGRKVFQKNGSARAGRTEIRWDGRGESSGVYLYRLTAGKFSESRKMLLLK